MNNVNELHEALARVVFADRKFPEVLSDITAIAHQAMPGTEAASITLIRGEKPFTAAYDGQMALDADELQYEHGYGPCVDAGRAGRSSSSTTCGPSSAGRIMPSASQRTACSAHSRCRYRFRARPSARSLRVDAAIGFRARVRVRRSAQPAPRCPVRGRLRIRACRTPSVCIPVSRSARYSHRPRRPPHQRRAHCRAVTWAAISSACRS